MLFTQTNNLYYNIHLLLFGCYELFVDFLLLPKDLLPLGFTMETLCVFSTAMSVLSIVTILRVGYTVEFIRKIIFIRLVRHRAVGENGLILNKSILETFLRVSKHIATKVWPKARENKNKEKALTGKGEQADYKGFLRTRTQKRGSDVTDPARRGAVTYK